MTLTYGTLKLFKWAMPAAMTVVAVALYFAISPEPSWATVLSKWYTILMGGATGFVLMWAIDTYLVEQKRTEIRFEQLEDQRSKMLESDSEGDTTPADRLSTGERYVGTWLETYHNDTRGRARTSFFWSILIAVIGFGVLGVAIWYLVTQPPDAAGLATMGGLGAVSAALAGYVVRTLLAVHQISVRQLNRYFNHPARMNSLFMAWRMAETLHPDDPARTAATQAIIQEMSTVLTNDAASTDPDAPPDE